VVAYGLRRADRLTAICRDAMGALADRHFSPLPVASQATPETGGS
jgi:hypothetical protein